MGYISGGLLAYMDILVLFQEAFTALLLWAAFTAASTASWTTIIQMATSGGLYVCTRVSVTFQAAARHRYRSGGIPYRESCTNVYVYIDIILGALTFCAGTARRFRSVCIKLKFKHLKSRCKYVSPKIPLMVRKSWLHHIGAIFTSYLFYPGTQTKGQGEMQMRMANKYKMCTKCFNNS